MNWLINLLTEIMKDKFTGYLQINMVNGTIANVNKHEKIDAPK